MRFRFCGDLDCPDWVLAEISTLAKISSVKMKLLCGQVLKDLGLRSIWGNIIPHVTQ
uniref:COMM domain containing 4 n=1 Tax=Myripristis murdjan TaxID=586833 RepID=A0A667YQN8_9TELE